jgi:hypothetical protein
MRIVPLDDVLQKQVLIHANDLKFLESLGFESQEKILLWFSYGYFFLGFCWDLFDGNWTSVLMGWKSFGNFAEQVERY